MHGGRASKIFEKKEKMALQESAQIVLKTCMNLQPDESCMIVFDDNKVEIAEALFEEAQKITKNTSLLKMPVAEVNGQEPPPTIAERMKQGDVILIATTFSR